MKVLYIDRGLVKEVEESDNVIEFGRLGVVFSFLDAKRVCRTKLILKCNLKKLLKDVRKMRPKEFVVVLDRGVAQALVAGVDSNGCTFLIVAGLSGDIVGYPDVIAILISGVGANISFDVAYDYDIYYVWNIRRLRELDWDWD